MKSISYIYSSIWYYDLKYNKAKNRKFFPLYGIFKKCPDGQILGYRENSFCMSWCSSTVRLWAFPEVVRIFESLKSRDGVFIYRLTRKSKDAKIVADFKTRKEKLVEKYDKREFRNCRFTTFMEGKG